MTNAELVTTLLALIVILLFLCWISLRSVGNKLDSLFYTIRGFMGYYERLNGFSEKERMQMEAMGEKSLTDWKPKGSKGPN